MGSLSSQVSSGSHLSQTTSTQKCISPLPPLLLSWPLLPPLMPPLSSPLLLPLPVPPPPSPQPLLLPLASWEELSSSRDWSWAQPFCPTTDVTADTGRGKPRLRPNPKLMPPLMPAPPPP